MMRAVCLWLVIGCAAGLSASPSPSLRPSVGAFRPACALEARGRRGGGLALRGGGDEADKKVEGEESEDFELKEIETHAIELDEGELKSMKVPDWAKTTKWEHIDPLTETYLMATAGVQLACGALTLLDILPFKLPLISALQKSNPLAALFSGSSTAATAEAKAGMKLYPLLGVPLAGMGALLLDTATQEASAFDGRKKLVCQALTVGWALAAAAMGLNMKTYTATGCAVMALAGRMYGWAEPPYPGKNPFLDMI